MIEFRSAPGGRYDCVEDLDNLRDAAMAINDFFLDSGKNFVITGCKRTAHGYTDGYVWLDNAIRYVEATNIDADDAWIVGYDDDGVIVNYADGSSYPISYIFGAEYALSGTEDFDLQAENGKFPTLVDFFSTYVLAKSEDAELQEISTNSAFGVAYFKDGCYYCESNRKPFHVGYDSANKRLCLTFFDNGAEYSKYYIEQDSVAITFWKDGEIKWQIGGESGNFEAQIVHSHKMDNSAVFESKGNSDFDNIAIERNDLKNIFAYTNYPKDTGWIYTIDSETSTAIMGLKIRQQKNRVFVQGILPKKYIMGADNANNVDPSSSIADSSYLDVVVPSGGDVAGATCTVIKTHVKLPDAIDAPNSSRIPGCVLSSDTLIQNAPMMCNVELHIGADGFFYISGKPRCMVWREGGPRISFEYLVD